MSGYLKRGINIKLYSPKELYELARKTVSHLTDENAHSFATGLPTAGDLFLTELEPSLLPVVNSIKFLGDVSENTSELVTAVKDTARTQAWRQPYSEQVIGSAFTEGSAWFPIADANGPVVYREGLVEIMLLNSGINYPKHSHSPEELYIVLAGKVWWEADGAEESPAWKKAGQVIHHMPHQAHAITAGDEPVLILNIWRGGGFEMPSIT